MRKTIWFAAIILQSLWGLTTATHANQVFKVSNFHVEVSAKDAETARRQAISKAEKEAFRLLLTRLVPPSRYPYLPPTPTAELPNLIEGMVVTSQRNSTTRYLATLEFRFAQDKVRNYLRQKGLPFVDRQAPQTVLVPILQSPPEGTLDEKAYAKINAQWRKAWLSIDTVNSVTPLKIAHPKTSILDENLPKLMAGDQAAYSAIQSAYAVSNLILAIAERDETSNILKVHLKGRDAIGPLALSRTYRIFSTPEKTAKEAASLSLAIIEGRWKSLKARELGQSATALAPEKVIVTVQFSNFREWQQVRSKLSGVPGIGELRVGTISARAAEVEFDYPGGPGPLSQELAAHQLFLENVDGAWILRVF